MKTNLHFSQLPTESQSQGTARILSPAVGERKGLFKSSTTKPLPDEFCNVPICVPEVVREEIDTARQNLPEFKNTSRNTFLGSLLVCGLATFGTVGRRSALRVSEFFRRYSRQVIGFVRGENDADVSGKHFESPL